MLRGFLPVLLGLILISEVTQKPGEGFESTAAPHERPMQAQRQTPVLVNETATEKKEGVLARLPPWRCLLRTSS